MPTSEVPEDMRHYELDTLDPEGLWTVTLTARNWNVVIGALAKLPDLSEESLIGKIILCDMRITMDKSDTVLKEQKLRRN